jgi:hypothetical protein
MISIITTKRAQRGTVHDARGRRVPIVSFRDLAGADATGRRQALLQRIKKQTKDAAWRLAAANGVWIIVVALAWSKMEDGVIGRHAFQGLPRAAAILGVLALLLAVFWSIAVRAGRLRRARLAVKSGFCGSCGYDLTGLHPSEDGNVVCPECGSAWRLRKSTT